jgi:hypothetical protein
MGDGLRQLALGRPSKEMAGAISISQETVKTRGGAPSAVS